MVQDFVITIDIDGTICSVDTDYSKCKLLPGCLEALQRFREKGYKVFLYTGRHINNFEITVNWLAKNGVIYDHLIFGKPPSKYYIDDRAIRFESWEDVLERIEL